MVIRQPTPRHRYDKLSLIEPFPPFFDIQHVLQKFPEITRTPWLAERLGKANAQRRDYLRYRRNHREKLAREAEEEYAQRAQDATRQVVGSDQPDTTFEALQLRSKRVESSLGSTKASTYVPPSHPTNDDVETASDTALSETSYATSVGDANWQILHVPSPPAEFIEGRPFECPFCYTIQQPRILQAWK